MNPSATHLALQHRFRFSFDVDIIYQTVEIDADTPALLALRELLLRREDLLEHLMVNHGLNLLADYLNQTQIRGGIQDFEPDDLLEAAANELPKWRDVPLDLFPDCAPILFDALSGKVAGWRAERLSGHPRT
jgi:hypothetical protein